MSYFFTNNDSSVFSFYTLLSDYFRRWGPFIILFWSQLSSTMPGTEWLLEYFSPTIQSKTLKNFPSSFWDMQESTLVEKFLGKIRITHFAMNTNSTFLWLQFFDVFLTILFLVWAVFCLFHLSFFLPILSWLRL